MGHSLKYDLVGCGHLAVLPWCGAEGSKNYSQGGIVEEVRTSHRETDRDAHNPDWNAKEAWPGKVRRGLTEWRHDYLPMKPCFPTPRVALRLARATLWNAHPSPYYGKSRPDIGLNLKILVLKRLFMKSMVYGVPAHKNQSEEVVPRHSWGIRWFIVKRCWTPVLESFLTSEVTTGTARGMICAR